MTGVQTCALPISSFFQLRDLLFDRLACRGACIDTLKVDLNARLHGHTFKMPAAEPGQPRRLFELIPVENDEALRQINDGG